MRKVLLFTLFAICPFMEIYGKQKVEFSLQGGFDSYDNWFVTPAVDYFPIPYVSIGTGVRFFDEGGNSDSYGVERGSQYMKVDKSTFAYHAALQPELKVYSPAIKIDRLGENIKFSAGTGFMLPMTNGGKGKVEYYTKENNSYKFIDSEIVKNRKNNHRIYPFIECAGYFNSDRWSIGLGYRISQFDVYGNARQVYAGTQKINFPKEKINSEIFLSIHYSLINN